MNSETVQRVVLITGAAGALGSALAAHCADASWHTVLLDKNRPALEKLYDRIMQKGGPEPFLVVRDLAAIGPQDCLEIVEALRNQAGRLDALVHCAASFEGLQPLEQIQPQEWLRQIQVNLNAPWLLSTSCLPLLRESERASLYFISEDLDRVSSAYWGAYGVGKHGLKALAAQFCAELQNTDIQVLALNPGPMRSPLRARAYHTENPGSVNSPDPAAKKILSLMERSAPAQKCIMNLADLRSPDAVC